MTFPHEPPPTKANSRVKRIALNPFQAARIAAASKRRADGCYLCKWIHEDVTANRALTDHGGLVEGFPRFPARSKAVHLRLERILPLEGKCHAR